MTLAEVSVKRPVFATMLITVLVVMGLVSFGKLGLELLPKLDRPIVTITTTLKGASPEEIETQLTKPIEEVVNTINGLEELRSVSTEGLSRVVATFSFDKPGDVVTQDVRDKVSNIFGKLPTGTDPPKIEKWDPDSAPVLTVVVSGRRDPREITELTDKRIKQRLEAVDGVGSITFVGERKREIQVAVDAHKLAAYGIPITQVRDALARQNVDIPGGRVTHGLDEKVLRTMGRVEAVQDFERIIVADYRGAPVRVRDIGIVEDGTEEVRTLARLNGETAVALLVRKQSGTNTVKVVDDVKQRLARIAQTLPPDFQVRTVRDQSRFIKRSFEEVETHLILGGFLAALVVFFFIRDLRSALIAAVAIPTSLIATFTLMRALGFTLNNFTMLALSLSTGIVIDDAIIVLENIYRHVEEEGASPREAAVAATREIALAVSATTLSLVVIFVPVAFMQGRFGQLFYSFGLTAACAILVSLVVAFSLTPMLCSRYLRPGALGRHGSKAGFVFRHLSGGYDRCLRWSLRHRGPVMLGAGLVFASTFWIFPRLGTESFVDDDNSEFEIVVTAPDGSSLERTDQILRRLEAEVRALPHVQAMFTTIGIGELNQVTDASIYVQLTPLREGTEFGRIAGALGLRRLFGLPPLREREMSQPEIMRQARRILARYPDLTASVQNLFATGATGARRQSFNLALRGPDLAQLEGYAQSLVQQARTIPGMVDMDTTTARRKPEVQIHVDRDKAADLGVNLEALATSLRIMVGGDEVTKFKEGDDQIQVRLRLREDFRKDASVIRELTVASRRAGLVRLTNLVTVVEEKGPAQIDRFDRERQVGVIANLEPRLPIGDAVKAMAPKIAALNLPPGYTTRYSGRAQFLAEATVQFLTALGLSLVFIYMVLAAQFESFVHPLTIMAALPLSLPFGLLSLLLVGKTLNIYSAIGVMMLFGVVKKNAILQVDYTLTLRQRGLPRDEALIAADQARLRPILMTTISIIAGMLPIALGKGDGSASRSAMATVVVGGQALCLFLTLLVTPVLYSILDDVQELAWARRLRAAWAGGLRARTLNGFGRLNGWAFWRNRRS
jgi:HAE1 family hydrophobic/amphiphilic exporter-1